MDFLTSALYSIDGHGEEELSGALLTRFDPDDLLGRAQVFYATVDELRAGKDIQPSGFKFSDDGILLSDTQARADLSSTMTQYVAFELGNSSNRTPQGLLDIILYAAKYKGRVLAVRPEDINSAEQCVTVPMSSFRVSNSSFNVYAPYQRDGEFRTYSLIDIETDKNIPFTLVIPESELGNYGPVSSWLEPLPSIDCLPEHRLFRVDAPFLPFHTLTGEGFVNYLAYNVASCNIGLKVIEEFMMETKYVPEQDRIVEEVPRNIKRPKHNVLIESTCKKPRTREVLRCIQDNDLDMLKEVVKDEEAFITFAWLRHIFAASERFEGTDAEDKTAAACAVLQRECRAQRLHFAIELLAQRYYICGLGFAQDPYGPVLKGGGVNGCGVKRFTW